MSAKTAKRNRRAIALFRLPAQKHKATVQMLTRQEYGKFKVNDHNVDVDHSRAIRRIASQYGLSIFQAADRYIKQRKFVQAPRVSAIEKDLMDQKRAVVA